MPVLLDLVFKALGISRRALMKVGLFGTASAFPHRWGAEFTGAVLPQQGAKMNSVGPAGKEDSLQEEAGAQGGRGRAWSWGRRGRENGVPLPPAAASLPQGAPKS